MSQRESMPQLYQSSAAVICAMQKAQHWTRIVARGKLSRDRRKGSACTPHWMLPDLHPCGEEDAVWRVCQVLNQSS